VRSIGKFLGVVLILCQLAAIVRIGSRLLRTSQGKTIAATEAAGTSARVSVIVPVLNEEHRLGPCLDGLVAQGAAVTEILVVDGGSTDRTRGVASAAADRDSRVRWIDASPVPSDWNGKAWGLQAGYEHLAEEHEWVLTIDADVRPASRLVDSLIAHAVKERLDAFSVATPQHLSGAAEAIVHPALLASMVIRYGIPGTTFDNPDAVQANGQCFLIRRDALGSVGGFMGGKESLVEDVSLARALARKRFAPGFYEPADPRALLEVEMYSGGWDAWSNWSRSLPMRDASSGRDWWLRMADMTLAMALPMPAVVSMLARPSLRRSRIGGGLWMTNLVLAIIRGGLLGGTRRAYRGAPWTYWLSPVLDPLVVVNLWRQAVRRDHRWRGRSIRRGI